VYDLLGHVHPFMTASHDGMMFSTTDVDNDILPTVDCGSDLGAGWWYIRCSLWAPTTVAPMWFSLSDSNWYSIQKSHLMVKLQ